MAAADPASVQQAVAWLHGAFQAQTAVQPVLDGLSERLVLLESDESFSRSQSEAFTQLWLHRARLLILSSSESEGYEGCKSYLEQVETNVGKYVKLRYDVVADLKAKTQKLPTQGRGRPTIGPVSDAAVQSELLLGAYLQPHLEAADPALAAQNKLFKNLLCTFHRVSAERPAPRSASAFLNPSAVLPTRPAAEPLAGRRLSSSSQQARRTSGAGLRAIPPFSRRQSAGSNPSTVVLTAPASSGLSLVPEAGQPSETPRTTRRSSRSSTTKTPLAAAARKLGPPLRRDPQQTYSLSDSEEEEDGERGEAASDGFRSVNPTFDFGRGTVDDTEVNFGPMSAAERRRSEKLDEATVKLHLKLNLDALKPSPAAAKGTGLVRQHSSPGGALVRRVRAQRTPPGQRRCAPRSSANKPGPAVAGAKRTHSEHAPEETTEVIISNKKMSRHAKQQQQQQQTERAAFAHKVAEKQREQPPGIAIAHTATSEAPEHTVTVVSIKPRPARTQANPPSSSGPPPKAAHEAKQQPPAAGAAAKDCPAVLVNSRPYRILNQIAKGGSAVVYRCLGEKNEVLALKKVDLKGADDHAILSYMNEIKILDTLKDCPLVVRLVDAEITFVDDDEGGYILDASGQCLPVSDVGVRALDYQQKRPTGLVIVMECGDSALNDALKIRRRLNRQKHAAAVVDPNYIRITWQMMLEAVHSIHERGVVHSDLKPANFVLAGGVIKLIDFGIAGCINGDETSALKQTLVGTPNYMAPEQFNATAAGAYKAGPASDVWSLGCILYDLVYGKTPFKKIVNPLQKMSAIRDEGFKIAFADPGDKALLDVLQQCLTRNYKERPTVAELLRHSYLEPAASKPAAMEGQAAAGVSEAQLKALFEQIQLGNGLPASPGTLSRGVARQMNSGAQAVDLREFVGKHQPFRGQGVAKTPVRGGSRLAVSSFTAPGPGPSSTPRQRPSGTVTPRVARPARVKRLPLGTLDSNALLERASSLKPVKESKSERFMRQKQAQAPLSTGEYLKQHFDQALSDKFKVANGHHEETLSATEWMTHHLEA